MSYSDIYDQLINEYDKTGSATNNNSRSNNSFTEAPAEDTNSGTYDYSYVLDPMELETVEVKTTGYETKKNESNGNTPNAVNRRQEEEEEKPRHRKDDDLPTVTFSSSTDLSRDMMNELPY
ncbi:hypothetical protein ADEAN_000109500 [Angomonas deanei]|uniref:Uncharacterized protein n=1 Tax=Angomonas deanei TaxID=59799 RepID=A0A7G2C6R1_9TRYP|nr:hypothetical protein ADEAN_000109500 [Angomonas deanei]